MIKILHSHFTVEVPTNLKEKSRKDIRQQQIRDNLFKFILDAYFDGAIGLNQLEGDERMFPDVPEFSGTPKHDLEEYEIRMYVVDQDDSRFDSYDPYEVASDIVAKYSRQIRASVQYRLVREIEEALANHTEVHVHGSP